MKLENVYWICGTVLGGKSTMANRLGHDHGLDVYHMDAHHVAHQDRASEDKHPLLWRQRRERGKGPTRSDWWADNTGKELLPGHLRFNEEIFEMTLEDIAGMDSDNLVAEGIHARPELLHKYADPTHTICIVTGDEFRRSIRARIAPRFAVEVQLSEHPRAELARQHGDELFHLLTEHVLSAAERLNMKIIHNDGSRTLDQIYDEVRSHFGLNS